jgi:hypothetical protein
MPIKANAAQSNGEIHIAENGLDLDALEALIHGDALVVRVPHFVSAEICKALSVGAQGVGYNDYLNAPTVGRIGMSYYETGGRKEIKDLYFKTAVENIRLLRNACAPYAFPIDTLRCELDEIWPEGAQLQNLGGKKMFVGLSRNMRPGAPLLAHHDIFARLAPDSHEALSLVRQIAGNVYIGMPERGGELLMWRREISDAEFLERRGEMYGLPIESLGDPDIQLAPEAGECILFNARKLHAVAPGYGGDRLTLSCFVGYRGNDKPLTLWS